MTEVGAKATQTSALGKLSLDAVTIEATTRDGGFRLLSGQRLKRFIDDHFHLQAEDVASVGHAGIVSLDNARRLGRDAFDPKAAETFQIELAGISGATAGHSHAILTGFFSEQAAQGIGLTPPAEWSKAAVHRIDHELENEAKGFDLCIATYRPGDWCIQHAQLVVADRWLVCLWQPPHDDDGNLKSGNFPLPGSRVRQHFTHTNIDGFSGPERLARLVQDVMRHNEYQEELISSLIDNWELQFFRAFGINSVDERDETITRLQAELSELRAFVGAVHLANKTVWRRAQNQPAFPAVVKVEVIDRCRELERALVLRRAELREAFALMAGAAADQQARAAQRTEDRVRALTGLATYATGLVLVPGLVVGIYGANVLGLPGEGAKSGLWYLLLLCLIAAVVTISLFAKARRKRQ